MDAIIGASGLVGSLLCNLLSADKYTSANISSIAGKSYDTLWVAAPSAVKWKANAEPDADVASIRQLHTHVQSASIRRVVHFSTVDVYGSDQLRLGPTESDTPVPDCAYGANRFWLENSWAAEQVAIIRLPGLFGTGLKKNVIYDLLNKNNYTSISLGSAYQWYDLSDIGALIKAIPSNSKTVINVSVEPVLTKDIVHAYFSDATDKCLGTASILYDMRSINGYRFSKDQVLEQLGRYISTYSDMRNNRS